METYDWEDFVKEIKITFSDRTKAADAKWKIKTFKQEKWNTADFMIEFKALAIKADTDDLHAIFLLKKNVWTDIIKMIPIYCSTRDTKGVEDSNHLSGTRMSQ